MYEQVILVDGRFVRLAPGRKHANAVAAKCREVCVKYDNGFYRSVDPGTPESFLARDVTGIERAKPTCPICGASPQCPQHMWDGR